MGSSANSAKLPAELRAALANDGEARDLFDAMTPSHRHEYVQWVKDAKRPSTRERRATKVIEHIHRRRVETGVTRRRTTTP
jgi:uncharacterized protein YdeI (YjbR/CyaY-like superfamily)